MKITEVKTYRVAGRGWPRYPWVFVEVCTDAGISGFGESTPGRGAFAAIDQLGARRVGEDPFQITRWFTRLVRRPVHIPFVCGIEIALWDILGKRLGVPVYQLLGGRCHNRLRVYVDGFFRGADFRPEPYASKAREMVEMGYTALSWRSSGPMCLGGMK